MNLQTVKKKKRIRHARNKRISIRFINDYKLGILEPIRKLKSVERRTKNRLDKLNTLNNGTINS